MVMEVVVSIFEQPSCNFCWAILLSVFVIVALKPNSCCLHVGKVVICFKLEIEYGHDTFGSHKLNAPQHVQHRLFPSRHQVEKTSSVTEVD